MRKFIPVITGLLFVAVCVVALEYVSLKKTEGNFCYPLDDTFIHMAVSKNLALHGIWGISQEGFVSTSSSPLFTALLAIFFKLFSVTIFAPLFLSCLGTLLMVIAMSRELKKYSGLTVFSATVCITGTLFLAAIPAMTLLGMEHTFQIAFTLFFVHSVATLLTTNEKKFFLSALIWGALMVATRYENAFVIAAAAGLLMLRKRFLHAVGVAAAGLAPIIMFGLYAKSQGGFFIPNSIMIKANQNLGQLLNGGHSILENSSTISGLLVISIVIALRKYQLKILDRDFWVLSVFVLSGLMHAVFASFGWFYRYEAYLIVLGSFQLLKMGLEWWQANRWVGLKSQWLWAAAIFILTFNLPLRSLNSMRNSIRAIHNIYDQQYQMGLFMKQHYDQQVVAANDIGAISYFADLKTLDLWGLGNNEVAHARKNFYWNNAFLQKLVTDKKARIAVIYDIWFDKDLPKPWFKVGMWQMPYNYICGDIKVTWYAMSEEEAVKLRANLGAFEKQLPADVTFEYFR
ncbi:MAG: glycosyltransferase family 39 protein [Gemmatimonadaceae bacterium]|nr:glycosyltransferase family 39 protein [Chitinophagaceae bacterium]